MPELPDAWELARRRALDAADNQHRRQRDAAIDAFTLCSYSLEYVLRYRPKAISAEEMRRRLETADRDHDAARRAILHESWMPQRPGRRMPTLFAIAEYWHERSGPFAVDLDVPACFACGLEPHIDEHWRHNTATARGRWNAAGLERAHLVDRSLGNGLDGPQNLVPLCSFCHRLMPMFLSGDEGRAIGWVLAGGSFGQMAALLSAHEDGASVGAPPTSTLPLHQAPERGQVAAAPVLAPRELDGGEAHSSRRAGLGVGRAGLGNRTATRTGVRGGDRHASA